MTAVEQLKLPMAIPTDDGLVDWLTMVRAERISSHRRLYQELRDRTRDWRALRRALAFLRRKRLIRLWQMERADELTGTLVSRILYRHVPQLWRDLWYHGQDRAAAELEVMHGSEVDWSEIVAQNRPYQIATKPRYPETYPSLRDWIRENERAVRMLALPRMRVSGGALVFEHSGDVTDIANGTVWEFGGLRIEVKPNLDVIVQGEHSPPHPHVSDSGFLCTGIYANMLRALPTIGVAEYLRAIVHVLDHYDRREGAYQSPSDILDEAPEDEPEDEGYSEYECAVCGGVYSSDHTMYYYPSLGSICANCDYGPCHDCDTPLTRESYVIGEDGNQYCPDCSHARDCLRTLDQAETEETENDSSSGQDADQ